MNVPNALTIFRFILIPVYLVIYFEDHMGLAFTVLIIAGLTDILDGYLARRKKQTTVLGSLLDPLADKTLMLAIIVSFLCTNRVHWEAAAALFIREGGMIAGSAVFYFRGKRTVPAIAMGKLTAVLYYVAIPLIMFDAGFAIGYLWAVIAFSFVTSFIYISRIREINRP